MGWMRLGDDPWMEDHCSGKTAELEYASPMGSEVWKLNTPDLYNQDIMDPDLAAHLAAKEIASTKEVDPNGIPQHDPGAKNDKGKMMGGLLLNFPRALWAVGAVATYGAEKYTRDGWEHVPSGLQRYHDAEMRHLLLGKMEELDPESGMPHEWHRVWNAIACLELSLRAKEQK